MLDKLVPGSLPYPIRGGIIRAIRTGVAMIMAGVATSIADGSIIQGLNFIPAEYAPAVLLGLSTAFVGIDKWLRERGLEGDVDANLDVPTSGAAGPA